jgi:hypothetical protein
VHLQRYPQARNPVIAWPRPHQLASHVRTHCLLDGKYSMNTVVSMIRLPPPPNPRKAINVASAGQLGEAPAIVQNTEQMNKLTLNAIFRPIMSALIPQNKAPNSMPMYTAIVSAWE